MKMMVKLAILFTTLLLLTGVSFAGSSCPCYDITATELGDPQHTESAFVEICLEYENMKGTANIIGSPLGTAALALFFEPLGLKILAYPGGTSQPPGACVGSFKTHGHYNNVVTGIGYCVGERWTLWGHKTDSSNCY